MKIQKGMYVKTQDGRICRILKLNEPFEDDGYLDHNDIGSASIQEKNVIKASFNLIDLIEYMDLLEIEGSIKIYGENKTVALFNPVRCDGFTEFEDGTHCIILNLDYLVDVKDLKIKSVLTKEQFNACKYVVERDTNENI